MAATASATRRDLPTPAAPRTVTTCRLASRTARRPTQSNRCSSVSRPTNGASWRLRLPARASRPEPAPAARPPPPLAAAQGERLDGFGLDRVADQGPGRAAEQDRPGGRRLFEAGGDVDGVTDHDGVPEPGVTGQDRPGVDAGVQLQPHAPVGLQLVVEPLQSPVQPGGGPGRPEASSSWAVGMPNTAMAASPANFCTVPPCLASSVWAIAYQRPITSDSASGSKALTEPDRAGQVAEDDGDDLAGAPGRRPTPAGGAGRRRGRTGPVPGSAPRSSGSPSDLSGVDVRGRIKR